MPCIYKHINAKTEEVFYVGKANDSKSRPYQKTKPHRSQKYCDYIGSNLGGDTSMVRVEVIDCVNEGDALKKEWELIKALKPVCNTQYLESESKPAGCLITFLKESELIDGMVSLSDVFRVGNSYRETENKPALQINAFLKSAALDTHIDAVSAEWGIEKDNLIKTIGKGKNTNRLCHFSVAMLAAEQLSKKFHVAMHKAFIESSADLDKKLGGTELKKLNAAISKSLGDFDVESYKDVAKKVREKILGEGAITADWNSASVDQMHQRYEMENKLSEMLRLNVVQDFDHLKQLIDKI